MASKSCAASHGSVLLGKYTVQQILLQSALASIRLRLFSFILVGKSLSMKRRRGVGCRRRGSAINFDLSRGILNDRRQLEFIYKVHSLTLLVTHKFTVSVTFSEQRKVLEQRCVFCILQDSRGFVRA